MQIKLKFLLMEPKVSTTSPFCRLTSPFLAPTNTSLHSPHQVSKRTCRNSLIVFCFSLCAAAHIIPPPCLSYSSVSRIPSHLALHNCCHRHACVPLCGKLFLCCAMAIEDKDPRGCVDFFNSPAL